ncbi:MAG: 3-methyladenine DNA glycosylase [Campylobacterota bacterium]|nr:3-methyladenine DNA glycosylase [Campylobacterota bacterium]
MSKLEHISSTTELYQFLETLNLLKNSPEFWWPNYGTFEVVVGAILTQNSKWSRVEVSLENLRAHNLLHVEALSQCDIEFLQQQIQPSGMYKNKSKYLKLLAQNIVKSFESFENFVLQVGRSWLLEQKGIGFESADAILCYACKRDVMVVDSYSAKLLQKIGYEVESYQELQEWFEDETLQHNYYKYHGMIVEFMKNH